MRIRSAAAQAQQPYTSSCRCHTALRACVALTYQCPLPRRLPQACLSNQLKDLLAGDRQRAASGTTPLYTLAQYTYGAASSVAFAPGSFSLDLPLPYSGASLVRLELAADSLTFVVNSAPGRISGETRLASLIAPGKQAATPARVVRCNSLRTAILGMVHSARISNSPHQFAPYAAQTPRFASLRRPRAAASPPSASVGTCRPT